MALNDLLLRFAGFDMRLGHFRGGDWSNLPDWTNLVDGRYGSTRMVCKTAVSSSVSWLLSTMGRRVSSGQW